VTFGAPQSLACYYASAAETMAGERMAARYNGSYLHTHTQRKIMIYATETQGRAVTLTERSDVVTRLNTDQYLRDTVVALRSKSGKPLWDGVSA
jgi:hypothetical protein